MIALTLRCTNAKIKNMNEKGIYIEELPDGAIVPINFRAPHTMALCHL